MLRLTISECQDKNEYKVKLAISVELTLKNTGLVYCLEESNVF